MDGGTGVDLLNGDGGTDMLGYANRTTPVTVNLGAHTGGNAEDEISGVRDIVNGFENVTGGSAGDTLTGDGANNLLVGGEGMDNLHGGFGNDILLGLQGDDQSYGEAGNDIIYDELWGVGDGGDTLDGGGGDDALDGGRGADTISGGSGPNDSVTYYTRTASIRVDLGSPAFDDGQGCPGPGCERDKVDGTVENVTGGSAGDTLIGDGNANGLTGGPGEDRLEGNGGSDTLVGGPGKDWLYGGGANDILLGRDPGQPADDYALDCGAGGGDYLQADILPRDPVSIIKGCETILRF